MADYFKILDKAHSNLNQESKFKNLGFKNESGSKVNRNVESKIIIDPLIKKIFEIVSNDYIYLAHITTREKEIIKQSKIMCSSGCLVGSVYCIPVFKNGKNKFSMHNLGKYIFQNEVSYFSENSFKPKILLFEIKNPKNINQKIIGLNYLKLGNFHYNIYAELKFLLHEDERKDIDRIILDMLESSKELIHSISDQGQDKTVNDFPNFYSLYINTIKRVPIFGYFLFEITSEYIAYNQNDEESKKYSKKGELFVGNFKELTFKTVPSLTKNFDLGQFTPDLKLLKEHLQKLNINFEEFKKFLIDQTLFYVKSYLFDGKINNDFFLKNWKYKEYGKICPHFIGHILHRIIRKMNRYPNFHINFDTYKAIKIWNYWNKNEILLSFNNVMLKGEVGINPVTPDLEYKIYKTTITKNDHEDLIFKKDREISVKITPQLVELSKLMMRKKYESR